MLSVLHSCSTGEKCSFPLSLGLCRGEMQHNPILMHLSLCDWNDCRCKAVCPQENSNRYLLSPVSNHPYDPSLQIPWGIFGLSHFLLCLCLSSFLSASYSSLSIWCHRVVYDCGWLRHVAPVSALLQGRTQQDTGKQKLSPSKKGSTDIWGWVWMSDCVYVCAQPSPWG